MNIKDLISIIIPVYNVEKYLEECLNSVVEQTYKKIEIILVDDCSTDNSFNICKEYASRYNNITLFRKNINEGQARARNIGIKAAKGEYIYFLDSDDFIAKNAMEILHKEITKNNCDMAIFATTSNISEMHDDVSYNKSILDNYHLLKGAVYMNIHQVPWDKLCRKRIFDDNNIKFFDMRYYEDGPTIIELIIHINKAIIIDKKLHYYRIVNESTSHKLQTVEHRSNYLKNRRVVLDLIKTCQYDDIKLKALNNTLASMIKMYYNLTFVNNKHIYKQCANDYYQTHISLIKENKNLYKQLSLKYRFFYFWFKYIPIIISLILHKPLENINK